MTWIEAKTKARELMTQMRAAHTPEEIRLILRALTREFFTREKPNDPPNAKHRPRR